MRPLGTKYVILVLGVATAWGAFARLWNVETRSFWRDEAWVASAVRDHSCPDLLRQSTVPMPPLFAVTAKLTGQLVQPPELGLRLPAGLWGALAVPLVYAAARALRAPRTLALGATGLAASCLMLVIWSRELKHYSFEGLVSVAIALLVFRVRRARSTRGVCLLGGVIAAVCLIAPWYGYGSIFPIVSMLPLLVILKPVSGTRRRSACIGLGGLLLLAVGVTAVWFSAARGQAADPALVKFGALWYPNVLDGRSWVHTAGYAAVTSYIFFFPQDWCLPAQSGQDRLLLAVLVVGVWMLALVGVLGWPWKSRVELCCWLLGPWLTLLAAALAHRYPFALPRVMQFCAPAMVLAVTAGAFFLTRGLSRMLLRRGAPALLALMFLGVLPAAYVFQQAAVHRYSVRQDFPAALSVLREQRRSGELVFVDHTAAPGVTYYAPHLSPPIVTAPTASGTLCPDDRDPADLARRAARTAGERFWILYVDEPPGNLHSASLEAIRRSGYVLEVVASCGGTRGAGAAMVLVARRR